MVHGDNPKDDEDKKREVNPAPLSTHSHRPRIHPPNDSPIPATQNINGLGSTGETEVSTSEVDGTVRVERIPRPGPNMTQNTIPTETV